MRLSGDRSDGSHDVISIDLIDDDIRLTSANGLVNRMYAWRGYGDQHRIDTGSNSASFMTSSDGSVLGTLTLTADSPAELAVDRTFPDEVARLRDQSDTRLCELTKFAFDSDAPAKPVLAALFHTIFIYGSARFGSTDLLIEVSPRHSRFYEAMLGFERVGKVVTNQNVGVLSQLMRLKVADIGAQIGAHARCGGAKHSLYPYFLSEIEEHAVRVRVSEMLVGKPASGIRRFS